MVETGEVAEDLAVVETGEVAEDLAVVVVTAEDGEDLAVVAALTGVAAGIGPGRTKLPLLRTVDWDW